MHEETRTPLLRRILVGTLVAIFIVAALFGLWMFFQRQPIKHPITLTFVGWTNEGPTRLARLIISNASDYPLPFAADMQSYPRIQVTQLVSREKREDIEHSTISNVTEHLYVGFRPVSLPPRVAARCTLRWEDGYTNAAVSISYLPRRTAVADFFQKITALMRDQPIITWRSAPLEAPWVTERQRRGMPRLGTNDNL